MQTTHYPRSLFEDSWKLEHAIQGDLKEAIAQQLPITSEFTERLRNYPHVLAPFIAKGLIPVETVRQILDTPDRVFRALISQYDELKQMLEPLVVRDLEALERLIVTFKEAEEYGVGMRPLSESYESYYRALRSDPNRFLRVSDNPEEAEPILLSECERKILQSAPHAYFYVDKGEVSSLPNEIVEVIQSSQEYSCRLIVEHGELLTQEQQSIIESKMIEPKWIFHLLCHADTPLLYRETLEDRLSKDLPWMVEYMEFIKKEDFGHVAQLREKLTVPARESGLIPELLQWQYTRFPRLHAQQAS